MVQLISPRKYQILLFVTTEAVSTSIDTINGEVIVCSRDRLSLVCSHNYTSAGVTRWEVTGTPQCLLSHDPPSSTTEACGDFFITNVSDKNGPTLNSTAEIIPNASLDGVMVECRAGSSSTSKLIGNVTIRILSESVCFIILNVLQEYTCYCFICNFSIDTSFTT